MTRKGDRLVGCRGGDRLWRTVRQADSMLRAWKAAYFGLCDSAPSERRKARGWLLCLGITTFTWTTSASLPTVGWQPCSSSTVACCCWRLAIVCMAGTSRHTNHSGVSQPWLRRAGKILHENQCLLRLLGISRNAAAAHCLCFRYRCIPSVGAFGVSGFLTSVLGIYMALGQSHNSRVPGFMGPVSHGTWGRCHEAEGSTALLIVGLTLLPPGRASELVQN